MDFINEAKEKISKFLAEHKKTSDEAKTSLKRWEASKNSSINVKARKRFEKLLAEYNGEEEITEKIEAALFFKAYQAFTLKNPESAKFPELDEFNISVNEESPAVYTVTAYVYATNSYGAQVGEEQTVNLVKNNGEWACVGGKMSTSMKWIAFWVIISILIPLISYCSISSSLSQF